MRRLRTTKPFTCVTCELDILGRPTLHLGLPFCCAGCAGGGACSCSYDPEVQHDSRVRHCLDVADVWARPALAIDERRAKLSSR